MTVKVVVVGGSGMLGSSICQSVLARGLKPISLSRSGAPPSDISAEWQNNVTWVKADVFDPKSYRQHLKNTRAVIHTVGILLEANYKRIVSAKSIPEVAESLRSCANELLSSDNPLLQKERKPVSPTYEHINCDSAITMAQEANKANVPSFVYISAHAAFPGIPYRYISSKRAAEKQLAEMVDLRTSFIRPGFMISNDRPSTQLLSHVIDLTSQINHRLTSGLLSPILGGAGIPPLPVEVVAEAAVEAALDESISGVVDFDLIQKLANAHADNAMKFE